MIAKVSKVRLNLKASLIGTNLEQMNEKKLTFRETLMKITKQQKKKTSQHAVIATVISAILLFALL